jgi:hypothetical protein
MGRAAVLATCAVAALAPAGCGDDEPDVPRTCLAGTGPVVNALEAAPGAVRLADGTRLSSCVIRARSDAQLQELGTIYTRVADGLAERMPGSDRAAVRLGYLIAATRRGARQTNGIHAELVRRLEQTVGIDGPPPARKPAFQRGTEAGERTG